MMFTPTAAWRGGLAALTLWAASASVGRAQDVSELIVGFDPTAVFVGADEDMPLDGNAYIAIRPDTREPKTVKEAVELMHGRLPHWFLNAMRRSRGDYQCTVLLPPTPQQQIDVAGIVREWFWHEWGLPDEKHPVRRELARQGFEHYSRAEPALFNAFCEHVTGRKPGSDQVVER